MTKLKIWRFLKQLINWLHEEIDYTKLAFRNKQLFDENDKHLLPVKDIEDDEIEEEPETQNRLKKKRNGRNFNG